VKIKISPLDALFSEFIRKRAKGYCERCGKLYGWKGLQCSHFHGRAKRSVRWDEDNACALDFGCHIYFTSHPLEYYEWFKNRLGEDGFNTLQGRVRITHPKPDKKLLTIYFKQKIKELANPFE
tara:strand:- start:2209 stop:2577 length:369 start_codon:yes stop_codon:yes gene_type:complete